VIPDNILEECLNVADTATLQSIQNIDKKITFDEIKEELGKKYDANLLKCLQEKNYAEFLKPDDKSDLTTTKIELRKAECFQQCKRKLLD